MPVVPNRGRSKVIWITWERQRRNREISAGLGVELFEIDRTSHRAFRYLYSAAATLATIHRERPSVICVQNPSIVLALWALILKASYRYTLVIDAHNAGIDPSDTGRSWLGSLSRFLQKSADLTIVTNQGLARIVRSNGGKPFVLPDKIPSAPHAPPFPLRPGLSVAFVCTFRSDEPYQNVFEAARDVPHINLYVTGNYRNKVNPSTLPNNIVLLGFIPEETFWSLLSSVDAVMDLTTRENCLVCGAYEGIAVSKPLILSDTQALREYFRKGCLYSRSDTVSLINALKEAAEQMSALQAEIVALKKELLSDWEKRSVELWNYFRSDEREARAIL